jgi:hypothetical protein
MKRSRLFLGLSSAVLAVIGVAATKAHKWNSATVFYYTATEKSGATVYSIKENCTTIGTTNRCEITVPLKGTFPAYKSASLVNPVEGGAE